MIKYYRPKTNFPGFSKDKIYSSNDFNQSFYTEYEHLFDRLHSLKRFKINMAFVGDEQTVINEMTSEDYVNFVNKNMKVIPINILDSFKNKVYRVGDKITYKTKNGFEVSEIIGFEFGNKLEIIFPELSITDLDSIVGVNIEFAQYYHSSDKVNIGDKVYIWDGVKTDLITFKNGIKGCKYFKNAVELIAYYVAEEMTISYFEFSKFVRLLKDENLSNSDLNNMLYLKATEKLFGQELNLNPELKNELDNCIINNYVYTTI